MKNSGKSESAAKKQVPKPNTAFKNAQRPTKNPANTTASAVQGHVRAAGARRQAKRDSR